LLACLLGCSAESGGTDGAPMGERDRVSEPPMVPASVDHILLAVHDLQSGIDEYERLTGVRAQLGGAHPGRGTQNALVSLGSATYLEILAPNPADSAGSRVQAELAPYVTLTPYDWAVRNEDLEALVQSLGEEGVRTGAIQPGARIRSDGARLQWRTLGLVAPAHPLVPFFIQWAAFSPHPATTSPEGCTLRELRFEDPGPDELRRTFDRLGIDARVSHGPRAAMHVRLDCPTGLVEFPAPPR
jgi:hypothetical protein